MSLKITATWEQILDDAKFIGQTCANEAKSVLDEMGVEYSTSDIIGLAKIMADNYSSCSEFAKGQMLAEVIESSGSLIASALDGMRDSV